MNNVQLVVLVIVAAGVIAATQYVQYNPADGRYCTQEAKACPDGSYVGRNPSFGCDFDPCLGEKKYVGNSAEECSRIKFFCAEGYEYFEDENGCGCQAS